MANSGAPRWAKEIIVVSLWGAAAVNVTIYTWETALEMYKKPPLSAWKMQPVGGGGENGPGNSTGKNEGFLGGLGESLSKAFNKVGEAIQPGHNAPNPLTLAPRGTFKHVKPTGITPKLEKEILQLSGELAKQGQHLTQRTLWELARGKVTVPQLRGKYVKPTGVKRVIV